jgi:hypothetical protein
MKIVDSDEKAKQEAKLFFHWICQCLVSLSGSYRLPDGSEHCYTYSGCVVSHGSARFILTAGHAVSNLKIAVEKAGVKITGGVLSDFYGIAAAHREPIPFKILEWPHYFVDNDAGLDFALIQLPDLLYQKLKANGVIDFPLAVSTRPLAARFQSYIVIGFPEERVDNKIDPKTPMVCIETEPNGMKLEREQDAANNSNPRFVGRILDLGDLKSTLGFSGGPILGFVPKNANSMDVYLIAIQASWDKKERVFGCLIDEIYKSSQGWLQQFCVSDSA